MVKTKVAQLSNQQSTHNLFSFKTSNLQQAILLALSCGVVSTVYAAENTDNSDITNESQVKQLESITIIGNRGGSRTVIESPSPVDIITSEQLVKYGNTSSLQEILTRAIPSFKIDTMRGSTNAYTAVALSAGLRGLGGGYTLVLVNGKRRHVGAQQVNNSVIEEGYQAADLNLIPISSIARIEVLRDGAAAQYGSDAIAGVINIVLKSDDSGGTLNATYGGRKSYSSSIKSNGETFQLNGNIGTSLFNDGFINFGFDLRNQDNVRRTDSATGTFYAPVNSQPDPRENTVEKNTYKGGSPAIEALNLSYNAELPLNAGTTAYSFTTTSWRDAITGAAYRRPKSTNIIEEIYPDGTAPDVLLDQFDFQSVWGVKGDGLYGWSWDISSSYGKDTQKHSTKNNLNPSLGLNSPTSFGLQRYESYQWVNNIDFKKEFDMGLSVNPLNVAFGFDYRKEGWSSEILDALAYTDGGYRFTQGPKQGSLGSVGALGVALVLPEDEADISRSNTAAYLDLGLDVTDKWYVGAAGRFESYDDSSGDTWNGKLTSRYAFTPDLALRGTVSTGFVAPSLVQQGWATTGITKVTVDGQVYDTYAKVTRPNSALGIALGAEPLKPTKSNNYALGLTYSPIKNLNIAIDAYRLDLKDRISQTSGLTGTNINNILAANNFSNVNTVYYFANLFDTRTNGLDIIADYTQYLEKYGRIRWNFGFNYNDTEITGLAENPSALNNIDVVRFNRSSIGSVTAAVPKTKYTLGANWQYNKFDINTRLSRYDSVQQWGTVAASDQYFSEKWLVDVDITYSLTDSLALTVGADNLFNTYPDKAKTNDDTGGFNYSRISPFGQNGGYYYGRLSYKF